MGPQQLVDDAGSVLETTTTDSRGVYLFDSLDTGSYSVRLVAQAGWTNTTMLPKLYTLTRAAAIDHVDFGEYNSSVAPPPNPWNPWNTTVTIKPRPGPGPGMFGSAPTCVLA